MADFMTNFDNQRQAYLEHYGVRGMRWGVHTTYENDQMTHKIEMSDPKKANKRAVKYANDVLHKHGFTDKDVDRIANLNFSDLVNSSFDTFLKGYPENLRRDQKTVNDAFSLAQTYSASIYMSAQIVKEANKRLAEKVNRHSAIKLASPDAVKKRTQSIRKRALVLGGIGAVLTAIGAANIVGDYKRRNSPDSVLTKEGAALKKFIKGGKQ